MKKNLLKTALALAVITALPNLVNAQWFTTGNNSITGGNYLGTQNNAKLQFATYTQSGASSAFGADDVRMVITQGGDVGIGKTGGGVNPTNPANKLLVENGNIYDPFSLSGNIYDRIGNGLAPLLTTSLVPSDIGTVSYSNNDYSGANNIGIVGYCENDGATAAAGIGVIGVSKLALGNIGVIATAAEGEDNIGLLADASVAQGTLQGTRNTGIKVGARSEDNSDNTGVDVDVTGNQAANNIGVDINVEGSYMEYGNTGVNVYVTGINATNIGGKFVVDDGDDFGTTVGVIGEIGTSLSGGVRYGIYGNHSAATGDNGIDYAGYFNGDVFTTTAYYPSDPKLKSNIREYNGALQQLNKLNIKYYTFRNDELPGMNLPKGEQIGLMANNLKEVFPGLVKSATYPGSLSGFKDITFDAVNTNALVPVLVQAVKELDAKNAVTDELKKEVEALKADKAAVAKELEVVKADNEGLKKDMADMKDMLDKICSNGCGDFKPASTLGGTTGSESNLFQNVPNPFSNTTVIPYTIGQGVRQAVLVVTDLNGTELKRFSTAQAGAGTFEINMGDLGTGTYIYSLFTDGKLIDTKKMMLAGK